MTYRQPATCRKGATDPFGRGGCPAPAVERTDGMPEGDWDWCALHLVEVRRRRVLGDVARSMRAERAATRTLRQRKAS